MQKEKKTLCTIISIYCIVEFDLAEMLILHFVWSYMSTRANVYIATFIVAAENPCTNKRTYALPFFIKLSWSITTEY